MSDETDVLAANAAFYAAFAGGDMGAMAALWSERAPVACIHPGGPPLKGRDAVLQSWSDILASPMRPRIRHHGEQAFLLGDAAFVICYEALEGGFLIATNIFVREAGAWRMTHHQAGPVPPPARQRRPAEAVPGTVH
jgi:ketosteroid isomerase-like protein